MNSTCLIVVWLVVLFVISVVDGKGANPNMKEFRKEYKTQVIDGDYVSVPNNYCPGCGPKLEWED